MWRSYVHVTDLVRLMLAVATTPGPSVRFDTAGERTLEVGELAEQVRTVLHRPDLPIERSWDATAPADRYVGDGTEMRRLADVHGIRFRVLDDQIADTAEYLVHAVTVPALPALSHPPFS